MTRFLDAWLIAIFIAVLLLASASDLIPLIGV